MNFLQGAVAGNEKVHTIQTAELGTAVKEMDGLPVL